MYELFDRVGRRLRLTSEGEDLLRQSRRLLMEADLLSARARALKGGQTGILRVGATPMVIENTLSGFLSHYQLRHPGVEVHFVEDGGLRLPSRLEQGEVHLALVVPYDRFRKQNSSFQSSIWQCCQASTGSPADARSMWRRSLRSHFLLLHRSFGSREWFELRMQCRAYSTARAFGKRGTSYAYRVSERGVWDCGRSLDRARFRWRPGRTAGAAEHPDRQMVQHRLGPAASACCVCRAVCR